MSRVFSEAFIESSSFPVGVVSERSAGEKAGGGRPPFWEMAFWWTRKPLAGARAIIAGSLLPSSVSVNEFCRVLRLNEKTPHRHNPVLPEHWRRWFEGKSLLDPFAGFGSIPLEALRLGLSKVVAVELLPTAYVFLKAVLEYPLKYGEQLAKDVEKWGNWVTEQLRQDPIIQQLYEPDVAAYIGSWQIKCPHCGKWAPLIGNWWLARISRSEGEEKAYTRVAWMKPKIEGDRFGVEVVDINRLLKGGKSKGVKIDSRRGLVTLPSGKTFEVPRPNIDSKREATICLHCNSTARYIDPQTWNHYPDKSKIPKPIKSKLIWYVKNALRKYNEGDPSLAKLVLLVKIKRFDENLEFEPCIEEDQKKLEIAEQEIARLLQIKDPDIPTELIPPYQLEPPANFTVLLYGMAEWYKLFNSRQMLTLVKLTKLIREAGKLVEKEKLEEGSSQRDARDYAEAITACLTVALAKYADYNSITTLLHTSNPWGVEVAHTLSVRGITMRWNWGDTNPFMKTSGWLRLAGSWIRCLENVVDGLQYVVGALHVAGGGPLSSYVGGGEESDGETTVLLDDATILGKLNPGDKFDLIVTDPPYYNDVAYSELSDFYYVWLKRALNEVEKGLFVPKFLPEAFFKRVGAKWVEVRAQWEEFAKQEVSVHPRRFGNLRNRTDMATNHFLNLLTRSFIIMKERLMDDGSLATYYAHTSPEAWIALLEAGWKGAKFRVTFAFPVATESLQRLGARGKYALDMSIVVAWRKGSLGSSSIDEIYTKALKEAKDRALELMKANRMGSDLFVGTMASILSLVTRYEKLYGPLGVLDVRSLVTDYVYPATAKALAMALGEFAGTPGEVKRPESLFYLITKSLFPKPQRAKRKLDRSNTALLSIGTKAELDMLQNLSILKKEKENFYLEEPSTVNRRSFEEILERKNIDPSKPTLESAIDALHLLEYYALTQSLDTFLNRFSDLRGQYASEVEEAINIAAILSKTLPSGDPEKNACQEILARIRGERLA